MHLQNLCILSIYVGRASYIVCVYNAHCQVDTNAKYVLFVFYLPCRCFAWHLPGSWPTTYASSSCWIYALDSTVNVEIVWIQAEIIQKYNFQSTKYMFQQTLILNRNLNTHINSRQSTKNIIENYLSVNFQHSYINY